MTNTGLVYLSGPIAGLTHDEARYGWRAELADAVFDLPGLKNFDFLSPMRHEGHLSEAGIITDNVLDTHPLTTKKGIRSKDMMDIKRADLVVVCVLGAKKISWGTTVEMGWAEALGKPIILVIEPEGNIHDQFFFTNAADWRVSTIREAAAMTTSLMSTGL